MQESYQGLKKVSFAFVCGVLCVYVTWSSNDNLTFLAPLRVVRQAAVDAWRNPPSFKRVEDDLNAQLSSICKDALQKQMRISSMQGIKFFVTTAEAEDVWKSARKVFTNRDQKLMTFGITLKNRVVDLKQEDFAAGLVELLQVSVDLGEESILDMLAKTFSIQHVPLCLSFFPPPLYTLSHPLACVFAPPCCLDSVLRASSTARIIGKGSDLAI